MSASLKPLTPAIKDWLLNATNCLNASEIPSARLDSEILLAYSLKKDRTYLHAHPEQKICSKSLRLANSYLKKRQNRLPIAYIIGHKEFYGRDFKVTRDTLIPRPESEAIIEILSGIIPALTDCRPLLPQTAHSTCGQRPARGVRLLRTVCLKQQLPATYRPPHNKYRLLDVGTGSGCLGITAKLEFPNLDVTLADISSKALRVAKLNARALKASVNMLQSDLLAKCHHKFNIIVANLPYVDKNWACSAETKFEPSLALFADDNGKQLIKKLIVDAPDHLNAGGYLVIEADPRQHQSLINYAKSKSYELVKITGYAVALRYITE